ncbi:2156_t:CDS:2 [Acaulospora colombiana]|uniref:2156_t:CDS:1 n=1 Tax=Acaulospora colombiana TaxID=27376 RepID=A0ACA9NEX0_9GLOM|nr:2156_t:CDS:2 [Acaulospora colombiana]
MDKTKIPVGGRITQIHLHIALGSFKHDDCEISSDNCGLLDNERYVNGVITENFTLITIDLLLWDDDMSVLEVCTALRLRRAGEDWQKASLRYSNSQAMLRTHVGLTSPR